MGGDSVTGSSHFPGLAVLGFLGLQVLDFFDFCVPGLLGFRVLYLGSFGGLGGLGGLGVPGLFGLRWLTGVVGVRLDRLTVRRRGCIRRRPIVGNGRWLGCVCGLRKSECRNAGKAGGCNEVLDLQDNLLSMNVDCRRVSLRAICAPDKRPRRPVPCHTAQAPKTCRRTATRQTVRCRVVPGKTGWPH